MLSLNQVLLLGHVGNDPELRVTSGGTRIASFSLATSYGTGETRQTDWHACTAWDKVADVVEKFVKKGSPVHVQGRIRYESWQDKNGQRRSSTSIVVTSLIVLESKPKESPTGQAATSTAGSHHAEPEQAELGADDEVPF